MTINKNYPNYSKGTTTTKEIILKTSSTGPNRHERRATIAEMRLKPERDRQFKISENLRITKLQGLEARLRKYQL
jgi:hypothetical protein